MGNKINIWFLSSLLISIIVAIPIVTVFSSFFEPTGEYLSIVKNTFLFEYIFNSIILVIGVLITDHNVRETLEIVSQAYILHDGKVLMAGSPDEVVSNENVRRVYLGDNFKIL